MEENVPFGHFYEFDLENHLLSIIDAYDDDRRTAIEYRMTSEEWSNTLEMQRSADSLANSIMACATTLNDPNISDTRHDFGQVMHEYRLRKLDEFKPLLEDLKHLPNEKFVKFQDSAKSLAMNYSVCDIDHSMERYSPLRLLWEKLTVELARDLVGNRLEEAAKRVMQLIEVATTCEIGKVTTLFLMRVSRCFVWQFDTECVIMCRSALDTAFQDTVSVELCESRKKSRGHHGYTLQDRIEAALPRLIDKSAYDAAKRVKTRGDKTVHYEPDAVKDVLGTIKDTMLVIEQLSNPR